MKTHQKAAETAVNISNSSDPGMPRQHSAGLGEDVSQRRRVPEDEEHHGSIRSWQREHPTEPVLLQLQKWSESSWCTSGRPFDIWSKLGKCKSLINSCLLSWVKIKTTVMSFLLYTLMDLVSWTSVYTQKWFTNNHQYPLPFIHENRGCPLQEYSFPGEPVPSGSGDLNLDHFVQLNWENDKKRTHLGQACLIVYIYLSSLVVLS